MAHELTHHSESSSLDESDWTKTIATTEIILVRHAQSFNNVLYDVIREQYGHDVSEEFLDAEENRLRQIDSELSEEGQRQVNALKEYVASGHFGRTSEIKNFDDWIVLSSPMKRCLLTSQAFAKGLNKTVHVHPQLYESGGCYGPDEHGVVQSYPGTTAQEIHQQYDNYKCLSGMEHGWYHGQTSEESYVQFRQRSQRIADWIWKIHDTPADLRFIEGVKFKHLILVVHGNLMGGILSALQDAASLTTHNNTGYTRVQLTTSLHPDYDRPKKVAIVKFANRIEHLRLPASVETNSETTTATTTTDVAKQTGNDTIGDHWIQEFLKP